ncbi:MAG: hypothetical protein GC155_12445 [Alphaproteobacteria bacterium]|nr:hypothetical protein [Alphaproteobacteria bacterium]
MKSGWTLTGAAVLLALLMESPLPAAAAPPSTADAAVLQEANCVYDGMSDAEVVKMVDVYLRRDDTEKPAVEQAISAAYATCAAKFNWKTDRRDLAGQIALQGAIIDVVLGYMTQHGLKDDGVIVNVWNKLGDDDLKPLLAQDWDKDEALAARLHKALVDGGVPDQGEMIDNAVLVLMSATRQSAAMNQWLLISSADSGPPAAAKPN